MTALSLRRRLLVVLADEGVVEDPAGHVTTVLAGLLDTTASRVGEVLRQVHRQGLVEVDRNKVSGRTFRACLTDAGRAEVGRAQHTGRVIPRPAPAKPAAKPPPTMPILGPIERRPFDPDQARERALGGVA